MNWKRVWYAASVLAAAALVGCEEKSSAPLAPTASGLAAGKPASAAATKFVIDKASSKVDFMMEAAIEKIRGRVHGASEGEISVDPSDLTKTTGVLACDIGGIEIYQQVAGEDGKFGAEKKDEHQNEHARTWLQISGDAPAEDKKRFSRVEFSIKSIEGASATDVSKMTGAERKVTLKAKGEFLLHGRKAETAELEATFTYAGDKPVEVHVKSVKPFAVVLAEHDVKARKTFDLIVEGAMDTLAPKVAKEAEVSIEFTAAPH